MQDQNRKVRVYQLLAVNIDDLQANQNDIISIISISDDL